VDEWKKRGEPNYIQDMFSTGADDGALARFDTSGGWGGTARGCACMTKPYALFAKAAERPISAVQRSLKIGYNRPARTLIEPWRWRVVTRMKTLNGSS